MTLVLSFPGKTMVKFGSQEVKHLAHKITRGTARLEESTKTTLATWGQESGSYPENEAFFLSVKSVSGLWLTWGGTFALLIPFLFFVAMDLIIRFREQQAALPALPPENLTLFTNIRKEVVRLYLRANRMNYLVVSLIVLGMGFALTSLQVAVHTWWPLSPVLIYSSLGTYILYSAVLYAYFLFYKGFSRKQIIASIDHAIGLQQGLATTLEVEFEQEKSTMFHLLLKHIHDNFKHSRLSELFPWQFPELTRKSVLANLMVLSFIFLTVQASIPALASISGKVEKKEIQPRLLSEIILEKPEIKKDLKYLLARESLIIKDLSREIIQEDNSPVTRALAEELTRLAADLSQIAVETDNFSTASEGNVEKNNPSHYKFSTTDFLLKKDGTPPLKPTDSPVEERRVATKNIPSSRIKKAANKLAVEVDDLINELLVYRIRHSRKEKTLSRHSSEPVESQEKTAALREKAEKRKAVAGEYKKWQDSLKLKKTASRLTRISQGLMVALMADKQNKAVASSLELPSRRPAALADQGQKRNRKTAGSTTDKKTAGSRQRAGDASGLATVSSQKLSSERKIIKSYRKLKLVQAELEETQLLLKEWNNEGTPDIREVVRVSGQRISELNNRLLTIIEQEEISLEGGKVPANISTGTVPRKLESQDRISPPKEVFQKMAGELGRISRKLFQAGDNLGDRPLKAGSLEIEQNQGRSVPKLSDGLRTSPKTVDRLVKELGKISDSLKKRNWGLEGNPALFNPRLEGNLKELSRKLKKPASAGEARRLGKQLQGIINRFAGSEPPDIPTSVRDRFLAGQSDFSPPRGMSPKGRLTPRLTGIAQTVDRSGGNPGQEWLRSQIAGEVPAAYSGGSEGRPPLKPGQGAVSRNNSRRRNRGNTRSGSAVINLQPTGKLRNQANAREIERIWKNGSLSGQRRGRLGSGVIPHDPELISELRKRYGGNHQPANPAGQGGTGESFSDSAGLFSGNASQSRPLSRVDSTAPGKPGVSGELTAMSHSGAGYAGMMGANEKGMREKPLANGKLAEQFGKTSPWRSQPASMPEFAPGPGDREKGKAGNSPESAAFLGKGGSDLNPGNSANNKSSLFNDPFLNNLLRVSADTMLTRIPRGESLSGEISHRQSLGNRTDMRNRLSPSYRSLKNRQLGLTAPPRDLSSRGGEDLAAVPRQRSASKAGHQETLPGTSARPVRGSTSSAALLNSPSNQAGGNNLPDRAGKIDAQRKPAGLARFQQRVGQLTRQLGQADNLSSIKNLSQQIAQEFSDFRNSQLGKSIPPELFGHQGKDFQKLSSLNQQIQSMGTNVRQQNARKNLSNFKNQMLTNAGALEKPDLERVIGNQDFRRNRPPELKEITKDMSKIASELLRKSENLRSIADKLTDNLIKNYQPEANKSLAERLSGKKGKSAERLSRAEIPGSTSQNTGDLTRKILEQKGDRVPDKFDRFELKRRFQEVSPALRSSFQSKGFNPDTSRSSRIDKQSLIKRIKQLTKAMELEKNPDKIKGLSNQLSQLADLLGNLKESPMENKRIDDARPAAGKFQPGNMAQRLERLSARFQKLGSTPDLNRLKGEFDRLANHLESFQETMSPSAERKDSLNYYRQQRENPYPREEVKERVHNKIAGVLNRMDRIIDKVSDFYNQRLAKQQKRPSSNSNQNGAAEKTAGKVFKDTGTIPQDGAIRNALSMEENLADDKTFERIIKRLRTQRDHISKYNKVISYRRRKLTYTVTKRPRLSSRQPAGLEGLRFSTGGGFFPGRSVPELKPQAGSNENKIYLKSDNQQHYLKVETNLKNIMKKRSGQSPHKHYPASVELTDLSLSGEQNQDDSILSQEVPRIYRKIFKQIFTDKH
ncbi:MAG: hypothetical protein ACE5GM_04725 [bacterium]